jgi:flagellar biosynthesis protein FliP
LGATVIRSLASIATIALVASTFAAAAQDSALPVDQNSQDVRDAQKQCTAELKEKLFKDKVKKTIFGAEEEAFQRCKKITGWQSPQ